MGYPYRLLSTLIVFTAFLLAFQTDVRAQTLDDYRTKTPLMGTWKNVANWERYDGSAWVNAGAYPTAAAGQITILNGSLVTISAALSVDQVVIEYGGTVVNNGNGILTVANGSAPDLLVYGTFDNRGSLTLASSMQVFGEFINTGTFTGDTPWIRTGGILKHNFSTTAGVLPACSWEEGSTLQITGYTSSTEALSLINNPVLKNLIWSCADQTGAIPFPTAISYVEEGLSILSTGTGSLVMNADVSDRTFWVNGDFTQAGGTLDLAAAAGYTILAVKGDVTLNGGTLTETGTASRSQIMIVQDPGGPAADLTVNDSYTFANLVGITIYGTYAAALTQDCDLDAAELNVLGTLHCGSYVVRGASFVLDPQGTLGIGYPYGIYAFALDGNIQTTSRYFHPDATYRYECAAGNSMTGDGLPSPVGKLISANTGGALFLEKDVTVANELVLNSPVQVDQYTFTVNAGATITGSSFVGAATSGKFVRKIGSNGTYVFTLTITADGFTGAYVEANVFGSQHASNTSTTNFINRYWSLSGGGFTGLSYDAAFTYDDLDVTGTESEIYCGRYSGSAWTLGDQAVTATNTLSISGQTAFSDFTGGEAGALPVQLSGFSARRSDEATQITWRTLSEVNNYGFYVQSRSGTSISFTDIPEGFIPGHGTSVEEHAYTFTDREAVSGIMYYRLRQVDLDGSVHAMGEVRVDVATAIPEETAPQAFSLRQNYPNPFNPSTTMTYALPERGTVRLEICDMLGRVVAVPVNEVQGPGLVSVRFDASGLASGVYLYRLHAGQNVAARRMVVVR
jgi:hypothetical protein